MVRGFLRGQLVDAKTKKVVGDTGWVKNKFCNYGLTALGCLAAGVAGSVKPSYAVLATQSTAMDITQTALLGTSNSFMVFGASGTAGTMSASYSCSFAGANGAISVGAAALHTGNAVGGMWAGQTFTSSAMATNQNFNLTYTLVFASA